MSISSFTFMVVVELLHVVGATEVHCSKCSALDVCENRTRVPEESTLPATTLILHKSPFGPVLTEFILSLTEDGLGGCLKWGTSGNLSVSTSAQDNVRQANGLRGSGEKCNDEGNLNSMCKSFTEDGDACIRRTNLSCNSLSRRCQVVLSRTPLWDPPPSGHFFSANSCLTESGKEAFNASLYTRFHGHDGVRLHREPCEPFEDEEPENRCRLVSSACPSCWRATHLSCDPMLKLCLCKTTLHPESQFQFGNNTEACYLRPSSSTVDGYACASDSDPGHLAEKHPEVCKCNGPSGPQYFNSWSDDWWGCRGTLQRSSWSVLTTLVLIIIALT